MIARTSRRCALSARLMGTGRGRAGPGPPAGPFRSGIGLLWQATSVRNGGVGAEAAGAFRSAGRCCRPRARCRRVLTAPGIGARRFGTGPPAGVGPPAEKKRSDGPLPSKVPLSPARPVGRVAELLEVRHAGVEVVAGARVAEHDVAGRQQHVVDAAAQQADLGEEPAPVGRRLAGAGAGQAELARRRSRARPCRAAPRSGRARAARRRSWRAAPRMPGVRSRAKVRRKGSVALVWRSEGSAIRSVGPSSLIVRCEVGRLGGERPGHRVEVADQALELGLVAAERAEDLGLPGDQVGEIVRRGALERLVDDRRVPAAGLRRR